MREDDDEFRHYVPLLRRIIILVAVITAVPVVLWTITAFVRTYVGPPRIPSFHQLASSASISTSANAPAAPATADGTAELKAAMQAKLTSQSAATTNSPPDAAAAPKGPLLGDRASEGDTAAAAPAPPRTADTSGVTPMAPPPAMERGDNVMPPSPLTAPDNPTPSSITAAAEPPSEETTDLPPAPPMSRPVPLPRHRPHNIDSVRTADITPSNVPMPRPRPDAAGAGGSDSGGGSPMGFIQNLFH
jgi:cytoskeletal protein RodZ